MKTEEEIQKELDIIKERAEWEADHSCPICNNFSCAGYCKGW